MYGYPSHTLTRMSENIANAGVSGDTTAAGRHLRSFTANLKEAGALATAGVALAESIAKIAHWLGPLGAAALALL